MHIYEKMLVRLDPYIRSLKNLSTNNHHHAWISNSWAVTNLLNLENENLIDPFLDHYITNYIYNNFFSI